MIAFEQLRHVMNKPVVIQASETGKIFLGNGRGIMSQDQAVGVGRVRNNQTFTSLFGIQL